jgi:hypothetical protein
MDAAIGRNNKTSTEWRTWEYPTKTSSVSGHWLLKELTALAAAANPA